MKKATSIKKFDILLTGIGGQGTLTLKRIISYALIKEGRNFVASEVHGLAQQGGSVNVHLRIGNKVFSPLISFSEADLIFGLDLLEAARNVNFANKNTVFLVNDFFNPFFQLSSFKTEEFLKIAKKVSKNIILLPAARICEERLGSNIYEGVFMLGFASKKEIIPLSEDSLLFGIKKVFPARLLAKNIKAFKLGLNYEHN